MTLQATADSINALFSRYGLDHDVVEVRLGVHPVVVDLQVTGTAHSELALVDGHDKDAMALLCTTLTHIFDVYFDSHPPTDQLRLF